MDKGMEEMERESYVRAPKLRVRGEIIGEGKERGRGNVRERENHGAK